MRVGTPRAVTVAALIGLGAVPAGGSAATPVAGLGWVVRPAPALRNHLTQDCFLDLSRGWQAGNDGTWSAPFDPATGSWDPSSGGTVVGRAGGLLIDSFSQVQQHTGH